MNDNTLITNLIAVIQAGLTQQAIVVGIQQNYQPTTQGAPSLPCILLHKISDQRYGSPQRVDRWNETTKAFSHVENTRLFTTFQIDAIAKQNPANVNQLTASDYVNAVAKILQNDTSIVALRALDIGIFRISAIRQTFFKNEQTLNEASPSFDVVLSHLDEMVTPQPSTATLVPNLTGV